MSNKIRYWEDVFGGDYRTHINRQGPTPPLEDADGEVDARVDHGRWIVDCPCGAAGYASKESPYFMCEECQNILNNGNWLNVRMPKNATMIENELMARPHERNRNWNPDETLAELRSQLERELLRLMRPYDTARLQAALEALKQERN